MYRRGSHPIIQVWRPAMGTGNGDAEMHALLAAIQWILHTTKQPKACSNVLIHTDSTHARGVALGIHAANSLLARNLRSKWRTLHQRQQRVGFQVRCYHVRGHGLSKWNGVADDLAARGARGLSGLSKKLDLPKDLRPKIVHSPMHISATHVWEAFRINRTLHLLGTLCLPLLKHRTYLPGEIERAYENCTLRLLAQSHLHTEREGARARLRLQNARDLLQIPSLQLGYLNMLRSDQNKTAPIVHRVHDCPIDTQALEAFATTIEADATPKGNTRYNGTYRHIIREYLQKIPTKGEEKTRRGSVHLTYRHTGVGAELVAAGIISGARVYADQDTDPFLLPKTLRHLALNRYGIDFDDEASHPRAAIHLTTRGR